MLTLFTKQFHFIITIALTLVLGKHGNETGRCIVSESEREDELPLGFGVVTYMCDLVFKG